MSRVMISAINAGIIARTNGSIFRSAIPAATNKFKPNGGVINPKLKFTIIIRPKWTGSIPISTVKGNKIGVKIITAAIVSINVPTISSNKFTNNKNTIGFEDMLIIAEATSDGICSSAKILPNTAAEATIIIIEPVVIDES